MLKAVWLGLHVTTFPVLSALAYSITVPKFSFSCIVWPEILDDQVLSLGTEGLHGNNPFKCAIPLSN